MASSRDFLEYVLDQLSRLGEITYKPMMGEFIIYCQGKIVGGIYDDRLLVKPTDTARRLMPEAPLVVPYPGAKEMLLVQEVDSRQLLEELFEALAVELPEPEKKRRRNG
ncbi:MAG: TfoX/Sxy family protein [Erysipelotrichaceae bacterium]|nr:TfoX/Sxy family protein [Erysipelotrichaceae bacterium]